ncbi:MAG: adaptor protein MecA, partial [Lachnospiraceae bacterium]|nr:adaptor protein MecA [Lachnospiraceae bacterium]
MQIEVIGNLRIKCTLTSEYLKSRWVDIDDLAYGTEA